MGTRLIDIIQFIANQYVKNHKISNMLPLLNSLFLEKSDQSLS